MSEFTELQRALKEQSSHFDELSRANPRLAEESDARSHDKIKAKPGPGGGIEADPFHAGFFLLAFMLNGPRAKSAEATWFAWHLETAGSVTAGFGDDFEPTWKPCPLTGDILFGEALKRMLSDNKIADRIEKISVSTSLLWAEVTFDKDKVSRFESIRINGLPLFDRIAVLDGTLIRSIARLIAA